MRLLLVAIILLNSYVAVGGTSETACQDLAINLAAGRSPASNPRCETPAQLMATNINGRDFRSICQRIVAQDEGCQRLQPEKRMTCSSRSQNEIMSVSNFSGRLKSCAMGFVNSAVDLFNFVVELIELYVNFQVNSVTSMVRFLTDSDYRASTLRSGRSALNSGSRMGKAFLNSTALYFAREYPRNLRETPLNPIAALGRTLMNPVVNFITNAVEEIAAYYIPQYQCMNGAAKIGTFCRVFAEFVMPPVFLFAFLKNGINGLRALKTGAQAARVARAERRFSEMNEVSRAVRQASRSDEAVRVATRTTPSPRTPTPPRTTPTRTSTTPSRATTTQARPVERMSDEELFNLARSEQEAVAAANRAELARIQGRNTVVDFQLQSAGELMRTPEYRSLLEGLDETRKIEASEALVELSKTGASPGFVVGLYHKYSSAFRAETAIASAGSESLWSKLGRYVSREKRAGKTDQSIQSKLDDAFECK